MPTFKFILAATDFSESANNAVHQAAMLAKQHAARLGIVHVLPARGWLGPTPDLDLEAASAGVRLRRLADELRCRYDVTTTVEVRTGDTVDDLQLASANADLLVIGQRRRSRLGQRVFGRTAQRLVATSCCPVLVVKRSAQTRYHHALVPVDLTPTADAAIVATASLAPEIDLHIFHAFELTGGEAVLRRSGVGESRISQRRSDEESALAARMRRGMARRGLNTLGMRFGFGRGLPAAASLRRARTLGADLLVATRQQGAQYFASALGRIDSLLARSSCDLLIFPGQLHMPQHTIAAAPERNAARGSWLAANAPAAITPTWSPPKQSPGAWAALAGQPGKV